MDSNKKQGGYMHNQPQHNNHYNNGNNRGYNNHHSNNYNGNNNRRMDKKKQNNNNSNNGGNNYQYAQNEAVQGNEQNANYYNNVEEQQTQQQQPQQNQPQQAVPAYHYYPVVQPQPIFYADPHYYSSSQPPPIQAAGSPTTVGMYPPSGVIVATTQNLQVPNRVMTAMHQIPMYPSNQIAGYVPQQGQQNHQQRYSRHNNNRRSQGSSPNGNGHSSTTTNIYISGLTSDVTDESFAEMCSSYGKIVSSKAIINTETNECKGFGFVMYENEEQARNAMDQLNKKGYHVSFAKDSLSARLKNLQDEESTNIYISNIPLSMTDEEFLELFAPHNVISHTILKDQNGVSRGVGFARFQTREIAKEIIEKYNNIKLEGSTNSLQVRFADSNAQKKLKEQVANKKYNSTPKIRYQNNMASPEQMITYQYYGSPVIPPTSPLPMPAQVPIISPNLYPGMFSPMMPPASPSLIYIDNMNDNSNMNEGYDSPSESMNSPVNTSSTSDPKVDKLSMNMQNKLRINDEMGN
ncbi:RNA-binding domain-containing protein [Piromyces finnis]|uniref:RNA-binding domain-containing protein n=1 Tax=Piromyces finnis TaxID=1754191 RepID=A0A1Y1VJH4_9FUNG|nr:RNA-binding domain-containing protein [Piromyces finnis]|eukprot:ORX56546.1 RNA-binding domain-containing protein [Piromyces finnis]